MGYIVQVVRERGGLQYGVHCSGSEGEGRFTVWGTLFR